ncbi:ae91acf7-4b42-46dd-ac2d-e25e7ccb4953 [Sclerotinia trifoliorum]|uniref:Ae91acf7-4b42-46dd-ac2d-e25e7ccb4953 n=1 Tax=Sclerotinia trifoliorum TaxID=28548 RepID=A0A8H2VT99_9HELO|nr:ae91acf7-4b42-46dd-ac2d-e25e7ccb4953 [Sclerotinia trifoliorum]
MIQRNIRTSFQAKSQKKLLAHAGEDFFKQQLQPGGHLQPLFNTIQMKTSKSIQWNQLSPKTIISTKENTKRISLLAFCHEVLVKPVSTAVFGNILYEVQPNLSAIFRKFDDNSWKMNYEFPRFVAPDVYDAKDEIPSFFFGPF